PGSLSGLVDCSRGGVVICAAATELVDLRLSFVPPFGVEPAPPTHGTGLVAVIGVFGQSRLQDVDGPPRPACFCVLQTCQTSRGRLELSGDGVDLVRLRQSEAEDAVERIRAIRRPGTRGGGGGRLEVPFPPAQG